MKKYILLWLLHGMLPAGLLAQQIKQLRPSPPQLRWANAEIGAIFHLDMQVFQPDYQFRADWNYQPPAALFNPRELDTDQWVRAAKSAGATYAILVAKHCSGFSLWPTEAHPYSVRNTPWRNGRGDIVREFVASCKKYGLRPGLYASISVNALYNVDNPGRVRSGDKNAQRAYVDMVTRQLTELWTRYGELFEIWFDGGVLPVEAGGPDVQQLLKRYQPNAIAFQGPYGHPHNIRYVGNEHGVAPYPCWAGADSVTTATGLIQIKGLNGNPQGRFWCPGESDFALRKNAFQGGWFWRAGEEDRIRPLEDLLQRYNQTVGRNTNMLLGIVIDDRGLVPQADARQLAAFGTALKGRFGKAAAELGGTGERYVINLKKPQPIAHIMIQEDIRKGERVRAYRLHGQYRGRWRLLEEGSSIGHKRIITLAPADTLEVISLEILRAAGRARILRLACFN